MTQDLGRPIAQALDPDRRKAGRALRYEIGHQF